MLPHGVRGCHRFGWASSRGLNTMRRPLPASQSMQAEEPVTSEYFPANATAKGLGRVYECLCTAESQGGGFVLVESIRISFVLASGLGFRNQYTHLFHTRLHHFWNRVSTHARQGSSQGQFGWASSRVHRGLKTMRRPLPASQSMQSEGLVAPV